MFEYNNLLEKGISKDDFEKTRKFVTYYSKLWAGTSSRRLGYYMDSQFYGTDYFIDRIDSELKSLTVEDVNAAIRKYLDCKNLKIAVVADDGQGEALLNLLESNTDATIKYSSPVAQSILDEDKLIGAFPLEVNKEKSKVMKVSEFFEK